MKPIIGITLGYKDNNYRRLSLHSEYANAIKKAGGIPILLPPQINENELIRFKEILDGVLLSGGCDLDPLYFEEEPDPSLARIDPDRDKFEIELVKWSLNEKIPLFAICRGIQILNVVCGGSIIQHLDDELIMHNQNAPDWYGTHKIILLANNILNRTGAKKKIRVNSFHHQAIKETGENIKIIARSADGVIEAVIKEDHPFALGVQWHPERMYDKYPEQLDIFKNFVETCI